MIATIVFLAGCAAILFPLFVYGANSYVLLGWRRRWSPPSQLVPDLWPSVVVQIPVYNERDVISRVLRSAAALEYAGSLEIQLLDDSTDDTAELAASTIAQLRTCQWPIHHLRRTDRVGFKAGALANGLTRSDAELVLILDADFVPPTDFLTRTVPLFSEPSIACVQTRWGHLNDGVDALTRGQALGIDVHFLIEQKARAAARWTVAFNGTAGIWRRTAIEAAGGWSADTLTEDLDLSYRAWLAGMRIAYADDVVCPAEVPETMVAFKDQQRRWACGSTATARKLLGTIWRSTASVGAKIQATLHLTHYAVHPLILASAALAIPFGLAASDDGSAWLWLPILAMATGGPIGMAIAAARERGMPWHRQLRDIIPLVLIGTGLAISNSIAVFRGLSSREREFRRTPKGGARSSYGLSPDALGLVELLCASLCTVLSAWLLHRGVWAMVPFLILYAASFGYVGVLTCRETLLARRERQANERHSSPRSAT